MHKQLHLNCIRRPGGAPWNTKGIRGNGSPSLSGILVTVSARADVTVQNNGTTPAEYFVEAKYPHSFTTVGLLPFHTYGIGERSYDISVLSVTNGIYLNPGEQKLVQVWFKTQDGGQIPTGLINYTLVATTNNGTYPTRLLAVGFLRFRYGFTPKMVTRFKR